jgi:hypothetical protein
MIEPMKPLLSILAFLPALALLAGCNGADTMDTTTPTSTPDPCDAVRDECISKQQVCAIKGDEPACEPCAAGQYANAGTTCEPIPGTAYTNEFAEFTTPSGSEVKGLCQSWTLHNAEELWINAVELTQDESSHHSNWTFVPDDKFVGDDGVWYCKDRGYSQLEAALYGGVVYAQSTQTEHEVQKFPNGAAVRIPPYSRIIGDVHLLNATSEDITGTAKLTLYALPKDEVQVKLAPFHLSYEGLNIPPHADSRFTGVCPLDSKFGGQGHPFEMEIYFVLPHYHALGKSFFLNLMGGSRDGEPVFYVGPYDGEAHGRAYDTPFKVAGAEGFTFGCDFTNPRDEYIQYGLGDQEMCEMLGFADSPVAFESVVSAADPAGSDGSTQLFTGPCATLAFEWSHDKPGGTGP